MDLNLMKEFEELEGYEANANEVTIDDDEDDGSFRPANASTLSSADLYYEMDKRSLKSSGFPDTDKDMLQKAFDEEFKRDLEDLKAKRRETKKRQAQAEGLQRRRLLMERTLQEEQDELAKNYQVQTVIEFIKENMVDPCLRMDVNSVSARSLAKAMWSNTTVTCLDLSSNQLNDHAGSYLARILKRNTSLVKMELDNNELGSVACAAFGEALLVNNTLVTLSLDSNPLAAKNPQGFTAMVDALRINTALTSLNLWRTGINAQTGRHLADCLEENDKILFCDAGHNPIDMIDQQRIAHKLDANLAAYDSGERSRRFNEEKAAEDAARKKYEEDSKVKKKDLTKWLEDQREKRADDRRHAEMERVAAEKREKEEKKKIEDAKREAERKAAHEAAEKKAKAAAKKKK